MLQKEAVETDLEAKINSLEFLNQVFQPTGVESVGVRLWDGTVWPDSNPRPATLVLHHPGALRSMFSAGTELALAEAYLYNEFDIEGDIITIFDLADALVKVTNGWGSKLSAAGKLMRLPKHDLDRTNGRKAANLRGKVHSIDRDRQAVTYHYDVSNDFYQLFLDSRMVYSCAYFPSPDMSLEAAQTAKLEHICRKLRLQPGQRLLDVGCGWGGLAIYAAQNYGVDVLGITLSRPQAELANQRIAAAGLGENCRVEVRDYRELDESQPYDALVSIGMFEHVGAALLPVYFKKAVSLLKPGGVFLNHGIARRLNDGPSKRGDFSDAYVFPDGELEPISESLRAAEEANLEVRDVESLREHYALTLRHWVSRLESHHQQALQFVDEVTYRVWRLYMAGSSHGFHSGRLNVYQSLLVKPTADGPSGLPATRKDWYA
ncbi:MAG TPA: cyclopropane-fatty-acyl-phospholipid synthase family protein [Bellilinea sp.]|nr:cyclopropane-fatty-acyl-phospholipid synthase family protein [Bellilinea sp.]